MKLSLRQKSLMLSLVMLSVFLCFVSTAQADSNSIEDRQKPDAMYSLFVQGNQPLVSSTTTDEASRTPSLSVFLGDPQELPSERDDAQAKRNIAGDDGVELFSYPSYEDDDDDDDDDGDDDDDDDDDD